MINIGIHAMAAAVPDRHITTKALAKYRNVPDADGERKKLLSRVGERIAVPYIYQDGVTLGAQAVVNLIEQNGLDPASIDKLVVGTETPSDNSAANAFAIHELVRSQHSGFNWNIPAYDTRAACAAATQGVLDAVDTVASDRNRIERIIVVATDVSLYQPYTEEKKGAEFSSGAGAVAMLIQKDPSIIAIDPFPGVYTEQEHGFWSPLSTPFAFADGEESMKAYIKGLRIAHQNFMEQGDSQRRSDYFVPHIPTPSVAQTALTFANRYGAIVDKERAQEALSDVLADPSQIGNTYTASMYMGLMSLLQRKDVSGSQIGFFSLEAAVHQPFFLDK